MPPIIIYRLGSLGDTIVALPCFKKIAESFPEREKLVLTNVPVSSKAAALEEILRPGGFIDGVIEYPLRLRSPSALMRLRHQLMKTGSDTLIYLAANRGRLPVWRDILYFRSCGFSKIIGAPLTADLLKNRIDFVDGGEEPEAERLARTWVDLGPIDLKSPAAWDLRLTAAEIATGAQSVACFQNRDFFAINMGGKVLSKDWGEEKWGKLMLALVQKFSSMGVAVVGAGDDAARGETLLHLWPGRKVNLCGRLNTRECAAVLNRARLFIGHDSGPLHLAAAGQVPCVGLFGDYNSPRKWHPYGLKHRVVHDVRGLDMISVEHAYEAVVALLISSGTGPSI